MTYSELDALLVGRCLMSKKLTHNTYAERRIDGSIAIRLHQTDILTFYPCGSVVVKTGGWKTVTTKERINRYLSPSWRVYQKRGEWYWIQTPEWHEVRKFQKGDCITGRGQLIDFSGA